MKSYDKVNFKVLDGVRGLSAIYILIHHARLLLTQPYKTGLSTHPDQYSFIDKLMVYAFGIFKFGHEAVIVFFVLSGFVIHLKQANKNFNFDKFSSINYLKKRFIRIYPTLFTSFILCLVLDFVISHFVFENPNSLFSKYSVSTFLANVFLIPNTPDWGNNYPLWSLKHEWMFYLLYPILLWLQSKNKYAPLILVLSLYLSYIIGIRIPYFYNVSYTLLIWFLGVLLAEIYKKNSIKFIPYLTTLLLIYPLMNRLNNEFFPILDLVFGLIVMGILSILIQNKFVGINKSVEKLAIFGSFSYSIYLLHWPIQVFIQKTIFEFQLNKILPYHYWFVIISIFITIPIIYIIFLFTEKKAIELKSKETN